MSIDFNVGHRFEQCYCCYRNANEINGGQDFQAIGHLIEQAGSIHAVCLPCIQRENASRQVGLGGPPSMLEACGLCRAPLGNSAPDLTRVQRRLFTLRCFAVVENGVQALDNNRESMFVGQIISDEDMSPVLPNRPASEVERARRAARSVVEVVTEAIGRELVGRVVSFVMCAAAGAAFVIAYYGVLMALKNVAAPEAGVFVPREELNGLSEGFVVMLSGGAAYGILFGIIGARENPFGDIMERAGGLVGRAILTGLEALNGQIERINRAWADLFVAAAQQPIG